MIKAIIVDDEQSAIESLTWEIGRFCKNITIIDTFTNPEEAVSAINYLKPDCIFLDIEMPKMDGFKLLSSLSYRDFDLVVTTAYDSYAIKAFKENAIDYLLKPIDSDDLVKVSKKIAKNKEKSNLGIELDKLLHNFSTQNDKKTKKIPLPLKGKTVFVWLEDVVYCKSDGNYTTVYLNDNTSYLLSKKIKDVELLLNSDKIVRVHQSYVVNVDYIKEYIRNEGYYLILEGKINIPVSKVNRTYLHEEILKQHG